MLFDKLLMCADALAHDGTPTEIDLSEPHGGKGEQIRFGVFGNGLAGADGFTLTSGDTSGSLNEIADFTLTADQLNEGVIVDIPTFAGQYLNMTLTGTTTAGTYTAGIIKDGQTNL